MRVAKLINEYMIKFAEDRKLQPHSPSKTLFPEFLTKVSELSEVEVEIAEELSRLVSNPCKDHATMWIWAAGRHPSDLYFQPLCELLKQDKDCIWHEGIVEIFQETKNTLAVPCLEVALTHKLKDDPGEATAIRILETLAEFGTPDALRVLKSCLASPSEKIRDEAQLFLDEL